MKRPVSLLLALGACSALALPAAAASAEPADEVEVTAVVQTPDGLAFRTRTAPSHAAGEALADRWEDAPGVLAADVPHLLRITQSASVGPDSFRDLQWGLDTLRAESVWRTTTGAGVVVAVVDTGVQGDHPDLAGSVLRPLDMLGSAGAVASDAHGHGTHVAGIVAAAAGNAIGVAGLAPGVRLLPVRAMGDDGSGRDSDVARGIVAAVDAGADVVNLSLGGPDRSTVLEAAVAYAEKSGVVVVAAAGNDGREVVQYPAAFPGVLGVGAVDRSSALASFSTTGPHVDLVAPGVQIASTSRDSRYGYASGTSSATPFTAAAAALLLQAGIPKADVAARLVAAGDDLGAPGRDSRFGSGLLNVERALGRPAEPAPTSPPAAAAPALSLTRSASRVVAGTPVTLAGRATRDGAPAAALGVTLEASSATGWSRIRTGVTASDGRIAWSVRPSRSAFYRLRVSGATSPAVRVDVAQRLTAGVYRGVVAGSVAPAGRLPVTLQRRTAAGWTRVSTVTTGISGSYRVPAGLPRGTVVRVKVAERPGLLAAATTGLRLP